MPTPAEQLEAVLRLLNHPHTPAEERPTWIRWLAGNLDNPARMAAAEARLQARIDERTRAELAQWHQRRRFSRRYHREEAGVEELSRLSTTRNRAT